MPVPWVILASKIITGSLDKNHVRILSNSCKQDTIKVPHQESCKKSWVILASKILTRSFDKILDKNHIRILSNSHKQDIP